MDVRSIISIVVREYEALKKLLILLEEQHGLLISNDLQALEEIVERIGLCNRGIAEVEVERRKLMDGKSMKALIAEIGDEELDKNYRGIQKLLNEIQVQKESNDMLIKLGLGFSSKMLNILTPEKNTKTYNSYGKLKR